MNGIMRSVVRGFVIKAHKSGYPDPICFNAGDTLIVGELDTEYEGWVRVTDSSGREGWAPLAIVERTGGHDVGVASKTTLPRSWTSTQAKNYRFTMSIAIGAG